ncbi:MAG TPA: dihydropteroate synthase [Actinomycetota bacterium]|nr:dihydropteroate synthase [Actinomycetota bacterium]
MLLRIRDGQLSLESAAVMGVLNVTPDSFSDGGLWYDEDTAVTHALDMVEEGAQIIDVGGESTRPNADAVPEDEELRRVLPVIKRIAAQTDVAISIDTRKESVARAALDAGASIVNDTLGEEGSIAAVAVETGAAVVLMHSRGTPKTMRSLNQYGDVVADVSSFLSKRADELIAAGVPADAIVVDPGFGFAKGPDQNLELLDRLDEVVGLGYPTLVGTSRKSFIGAVLDLPEEERLEGTLATVVWALARGAKIFRVHDVRATVRAIRMAEAIDRRSMGQ